MYRAHTATASVILSPGNNPLPPGWNAVWSPEQNQFYYTNIHTQENTWILPTSLSPSAQIQPQAQYFPPPPSAVPSQHVQPQSQPQSQSQSQQPPQPQNYPGQLPIQQFQPPPVQAAYEAQQNITQGPPQQYSSPPTQQFPSPPQQTSTQQAISETQVRSVPHYQPPPAFHQYAPPPARTFTQSAPVAASRTQPPSPFSQPQHQGPPQQQSYYQAQNPSLPQNQAQLLSQPPYQPPNPTHFLPQNAQRPGPPLQTQSAKSASRLSMSSLSSMTSKFSTKLGPGVSNSLKSAGTTMKSPGFKKWGTRAAMGIGAIGAVTLGVDMMDGGLFDSGASVDTSSFSGGGDMSAFDSGGDFGGSGDMGGGGDTGGYEGGDATQTDVNASAARIAMEQQGENNALMLLDPVGTEYERVDGYGNLI